MHRSLSRTAMAAQIQRMLPDVTAEDLHPAGAGVRAQAVKAGRHAGGRLPVRRPGVGPRLGAARAQRAQSPAATAALPIGREIVERLTGEPIAPLTAA